MVRRFFRWAFGLNWVVFASTTIRGNYIDDFEAGTWTSKLQAWPVRQRKARRLLKKLRARGLQVEIVPA